MCACVPYFLATKKRKRQKYGILRSEIILCFFVAMNLYVGTSGYSYKEWKGSFYPENLSAKDMLSYYSQHFQAVELNNTFYRTPKPNLVESWKSQVPENFRFTV